jgi:hypothetical protein
MSLKISNIDNNKQRCAAERVRDTVLWQPARPSIEPLVASAAIAAIASHLDKGLLVVIIVIIQSSLTKCFVKMLMLH